MNSEWVGIWKELSPSVLYEGRLQNSWTHLITLSRNFVEVRWRSLFRSTSLRKRCTSYNAPPTSRKRTTARWSLRNVLLRSSLFMVGKAQKSHGARSELNSMFGLEKVDRWDPIKTFAPCDFWAFRPYKEVKTACSTILLKIRQTVCSTFSRSGWSVLSVSLAKGGTSKKRPSPHLHKLPTRSNKVGPRTFQTALVFQETPISANRGSRLRFPAGAGNLSLHHRL
jgi:hypothetical protein